MRVAVDLRLKCITTHATAQLALLAGPLEGMCSELVINTHAIATKCPTITKKAAEVPKPVTDPAKGLAYFGRVVDENVASTLNRKFLLPMPAQDPDANDHPGLFIDGSAATNIRKSGACIAWCIPVSTKVEETPMEVASSMGDKGYKCEADDKMNGNSMDDKGYTREADDKMNDESEKDDNNGNGDKMNAQSENDVNDNDGNGDKMNEQSETDDNDGKGDKS